MSGAGWESEVGVPESLRVVVIDDHEVLRAGTRQVLETTDDIVVVGEADDWSAALAVIDEHRPDIALVDIQLSGRDGIELARQLSSDHPGTRVVILSAYDDDAFIRRAFEAGVAGYLLKTMPREELINAVRAVGMGTTVLDPAVSSRLARTSAASESTGAPRLTLREREVVALVADGLSNKAIATRLGVSTRTVEGHVNHVFTKLDLESRTELVRYVLTNGLPPASSADPRRR
ncbi:MAG TPA: response regulator transcription factor [Acidimicrobiales bacterium]|nr:response regulator transcription factor [Acidimicrobiales bacterium]